MEMGETINHPHRTGGLWLVGRNSCPAALSDGRSEGAEKKIQDHQNEYDLYTVIYKRTMFRIADLFQYIYLDGYHEEIAYHIQNGRKDGEGENRIPGSCVNRGNNPQGQGRYKSFFYILAALKTPITAIRCLQGYLVKRTILPSIQPSIEIRYIHLRPQFITLMYSYLYSFL